MRDVLAGVIAIVLLAVAASLATTLRQYRQRRQRERDAERALGRTIVAEIPSGDDLVLFTKDDKRFYYGDRGIDKDLIVAVRMLINGAPIASYVSGSERSRPRPVAQTPPLAEQPQGGPLDAAAVHAAAEAVPDVSGAGIARDQWDVEVETVTGTTLIACGAIREHVSQELARAVFSAVSRELERRDAS